MWEQVGASKPWTRAPLSRLTEEWDLALAKEPVITIARVDPRFADRVVTSRRSRRILVVDDEPGPMKQRIARSLRELCSELGIQVMGEGVETPLERDALVGLGYDLLQGYLFARPGPAFPSPLWT